MRAKFSYDEGGALVIRRGPSAVCIPKAQLNELRTLLAAPATPPQKWARKEGWKPLARERVNDSANEPI